LQRSFLPAKGAFVPTLAERTRERFEGKAWNAKKDGKYFFPEDLRNTNP
jgi:hypothetical protein